MAQEALNMIEIKHRHTGAVLLQIDAATLNGADLAGANLRYANFVDAELVCANFSSADLTGADFAGADLAGADLTSADLRGADLIGAALNDADLHSANLSDANLSRANFTGVTWCRADIDGARVNDRGRIECLCRLTPREWAMVKKTREEGVREGTCINLKKVGALLKEHWPDVHTNFSIDVNSHPGSECQIRLTMYHAVVGHHKGRTVEECLSKIEKVLAPPPPPPGIEAVEIDEDHTGT
jgi:hypothetical protein